MRFLVGETWIILLQPTDPAGIPGRHLARHGEGFFLASFEVDNLEDALGELSDSGITALDTAPRKGLDDWRVTDLDPECFCGVNIQLVQAGDAR